MNDHEKITGKVIRHTVNIQISAAKIISRYYLKESPRVIHMGFIHDVLTNPHASFVLIGDILRIVLLRQGADMKRVKILDNDMRELSNLRNRFAHEMIITNSEKMDKFYIADRKQVGWEENMGGADIEEVFNKFTVLCGKVSKEIDSFKRELMIEDIEITTKD